MLSARPLRIVLSVVLGLVGLALFVGSGGAAITNTAQLDNGTCGRNLQLGSDKTASSSATPSFLLAGDGGLSSYRAYVDGALVGTFYSDGFANVCIHTSAPLADGPHVLTGNELLPHSTYTITPFNFTVDTVPPAQPSTPTISGYSDSGLLGDHITKWRNVNFTGFADPNVTVQLFSGASLLGGAKADAAGAWSATTSTLADGNYVFTAAALDQAGNKSMLSLSCPLTIDGTAPTGVLTNPPAGATLSGTVQLAANAADQVGIWKVDFQVDGVTKGTASGPAGPFSVPWSSQQAANGAHTLTALTTDFAGNTASSSTDVNVLNGATATPPGSPSLNSATAGNASVTLNWSAPASDGGSALTGYRIYRSASSGAETLLTTVSAAGTSYTDTGLANGSTYFYKVSAQNGVGESALSSERSAIPAGAPSAPILNVPTAGNTMVTFTWSTPGGNGSAVTGYRVYRSTSSGTETLYTTIGALNAFTDTGLTNGTTYYYKITAVNAIGESGLSNERNATPAMTPSAPTLNAPTAGSGTVALNWTTPGGNGSPITGYRVYRSSSSGTETPLITLGLVNSYTDTGLTNGTTYYYKVTAINAIGESGLSNERSATPTAAATAPDAPILNVPTAGNTMVTFTWSTPGGNGSAVTGYRVYRSTSSGTETLYTTIGALNAFTDTGLTNGTTYYYKITAVNAIGESGLSNERNATPAMTPSAPTLNAPTAGSGTVALNWTTPGGNGSPITGYRVYRSSSSGTETPLITLGLVNSYTDTGLTNGTTYYYKVTAINAIGESGLSNERSATPTAAATAPDAPILNAPTSGNGSVGLSWTTPSANGSALLGYWLYRSTASGAETLLGMLGTVNSYTDTGLTNGTTYYYKITAVNAYGESGQSNERSGAPAAKPSAPTLNALSAGNGSVGLTWTTPSGNGSALTGYRVYRSTSSGTETSLITLGLVNSYTDSAVTNGSTYYYKVTALNAIGESALSNERSASPAVPAAVPGTPTLNVAPAGSGRISLNWTTPSANGSPLLGYWLYRSTTSGAETLLGMLGTVNNYTDPGLTNGTTYYYKITAVNAYGESGLSNESSATPVTAPGAPTLAVPTATNTTVGLNWSAPTSNGGSPVTGYRVYRSTSSGTETLVATLGLTSSYTDTSLSYGITYYYVVTAVNAAGESSFSNERSATLTTSDATPPSKPASLRTLLAGTSQIELDWSASTDNVGVTGYRLYRDGALITTRTQTYYVDSGMTPGSSHVYQVAAIDAAGNQSLLSSALSTNTASLGTGSTGTLSGVVFRAGAPLANATATLTLPNGTTKSTKTNTAGVWKITNLAAATYVVTINAGSGLPPVTVSMALSSQQTVITLSVF